MATVSTHVLDTAAGRPAAGVAVRLSDAAGTTIDEAVTNSDGRVPALGGELPPGDYRLTFATGAYFTATVTATRTAGSPDPGGAPTGAVAFHPRVIVEFTVTDAAGPDDGAEHYHVPLLLSPFGYTTYRGS